MKKLPKEVFKETKDLYVWAGFKKDFITVKIRDNKTGKKAYLYASDKSKGVDLILSSIKNKPYSKNSREFEKLYSKLCEILNKEIKNEKYDNLKNIIIEFLKQEVENFNKIFEAYMSKRVNIETTRPKIFSELSKKEKEKAVNIFINNSKNQSSRVQVRKILKDQFEFIIKTKEIDMINSKTKIIEDIYFI